MMIRLDMKGDIPIYMQIRNQIVLGIGRGELAAGQPLPTVRRLAEDAGVNVMTVSKAYALLKEEGYIETDRRRGACVTPAPPCDPGFCAKLSDSLSILAAEARARGMQSREFLDFCRNVMEKMGQGSETVL